jgi:type IV pilus assembly protein PilV
VSLIEVLMAVLIFSVGLIGLAGLLIVSTRSNQEAFVRTQVTFLASSMADRMRANPVGLWSKAYDGNYPSTMTKIPACDTTKACGPADLATRDMAIWSSQLQTFLPGLGPTSITCDTSTAGYDTTTVVNMRPPFGGRCTMVITWAERGYGSSDDKTDSKNLQSFTWVFEP